MQENVSVWPPSEEDLELMSQRGFVCMDDSQHVGNFHVKTKAIIYFYRGRSSIKALNTLTVYIEGEELTEIVSRTRRKLSPSLTEILRWFGKFQGPPTYPPSAGACG